MKARQLGDIDGDARASSRVSRFAAVTAAGKAALAA
jgi:hypothetical protein